MQPYTLSWCNSHYLQVVISCSRHHLAKVINAGLITNICPHLSPIKRQEEVGSAGSRTPYIWDKIGTHQTDMSVFQLSKMLYYLLAKLLHNPKYKPHLAFLMFILQWFVISLFGIVLFYYFRICFVCNPILS